MKFKQTHIALLFLVVSVGIIIVSRRSKMGVKRPVYTIGILQTASHPALDAARDGFIVALKEKMNDTVEFVIKNGQGSISTIHTIAQQFAAKQDIDAVFAIATPAAQAMISVEKEKPIIVAAVSVTPDLKEYFSASNICGVSDMINVRKEVEAMKRVLPKEMQTVGIIFSSAEINSIAMSQVMVTELEQAGYTPVLCGIASEMDMEPAISSAIRKVDVLLAPTDNMIANSIALISDIAQKSQKPLIVSDNLLVQYGALMARGVDYYESGKQAGEIAQQVIVQKRKPHEIAIMQADNKEIYVNKNVLEHLGYNISDQISGDIILVN